jgi:S1-C subfamily serine protease
MISRQRQIFLLIIFLSLLAGATAGLVASTITNTSLDNYASALFQGQPIGLPAAQHSANSNYDDAVATVRAVAAKSIVTIMRTSLDSRFASSWQNSNTALGYGVVVSADGWVLLRGEVVASQKNVLRNVDLWIEGVRYTPTQLIADDLTDAMLIKIEANNLTPVAFAASEELSAGAAVIGAIGEHAILATTIDNTRLSNGLSVAEAEHFAYDWQIASTVLPSLPIFNYRGELVALGGEVTAIPLHYLASFVKNVMRSGTTNHAGLGAFVVDIEGVLNLDEQLRQGQSHGALLAVPPNGAAAVLASGPAGLAGLVTGDIITEIDGIQVDHEHTLAELLRLYAPGETAGFTVMHAGTSKTVMITFVDEQDLLY